MASNPLATTRSKAGTPARNRKYRSSRRSRRPRASATAWVACPRPWECTAKYPWTSPIGREHSPVPERPSANARSVRGVHTAESTFAVPRRGLLSRTCVPSTVELAGLAKYPFLQEASAFIRAEPVTLEELLSEPAYARARAIGRARVVEALEKGPDTKRVAIAPARSEEHTSELQSPMY